MVTPVERGKQIVKDIVRKYHLSLIDSYELVSLGLRVSVFSTEQEVPSVVRKLAGDRGVIIEGSALRANSFVLRRDLLPPGIEEGEHFHSHRQERCT